jgi:hypothetical protein
MNQQVPKSIMNPNPYDFIKKSQEMPISLQQEMAEKDENESLDTGQAQDDRAPLLDAYIDNRLRSDKPITFLSFIDDLRRLWEAAGKDGHFVRQSPSKKEADFPVITYRVVKRVVNKDFKDFKPRYRSTISHPDIKDEFIELYGQIFDVDVEFCLYTPSAEVADELTVELEEFLQTYAGYFKRNGVQEVMFHSQGEDEVLTEIRVPVSKRKLLYTMRFEKIIVRFLNEIQQIAVQANLRNEGENN